MQDQLNSRILVNLTRFNQNQPDQHVSASWPSRASIGRFRKEDTRNRRRSIWEITTCRSRDQAQHHADGYHSRGMCIQPHRTKHRGNHMTKGFGHKVQQVAKRIHKIRSRRWSLVKREGAVSSRPGIVYEEEELC